MSIMPKFVQKAAAPLVVVGALTVPASVTEGGISDIPEIISGGNFSVVYEFDLEDVNGAGPLDVDDTVWFATLFGDSYTDVNPAGSIFQSNDSIVSGIFVIVDGATGVQDVAYLDQGSIFGIHGNPFRDEVETFISSDDMISSFAQYGALENFTVTMSGPFGIYDYGPEGLDLADMYNAQVLDLYDMGDFSGQLFNGQTFSGDADITHLPAPGALSLLGGAALVHGRRRRRSVGGTAKASTQQQTTAAATAEIEEYANDGMA